MSVALLIARLLFKSTLICSGALLCTAVHAQKASNGSGTAGASSATPIAGSTLESDPIRCWLKSTKTSVHIGEQFNVALTCGVIETSRVSVVPDVGQIEPASIQLAPFEVLSGLRHPDIRAGVWRYFQYEYTLRLIADGFFGQDLAVPAVSLSYRVNLSDAGATQEGRESTYVLPQLPIRVVSLVPQIATDIRDAPRDTFADIDARTFRGTVSFVVAGILYAFAAVLLLLAIVRAFGKLKRRGPVLERILSSSTIVREAQHALGRVRTDARGGWTPDLMARALASLRIAGSLALGRPPAQTRVPRNAIAREGQLLIRRSWFKPGAVLLSAATTPNALSQATAPMPYRVLGPTVALDELQSALKVFSEGSYGRDAQIDAGALDRALSQGLEVLRALRVQSSWPLRYLNECMQWFVSRWGPGWAP